MVDTKMDKEKKAKHHREYNREWGRKNKDRISFRRRELYQLNKDKINSHRREYWERHKDKKREADKRYHEKHKLQSNKKCREYYQRKQNEFISAYKKGKCCSLCGYNKHYEILQFHHKDREKKSFEIRLFTIAKKTPEELKKEMDRCILICPNCHFLIHSRGGKIG